MKKILSLITLLLAFTAPSLAAEKTVYLDVTPVNNVNWPSGARFALCMRTIADDGSTESWQDLTKVDSESNLYKVTVPDGIASIIFCRMDGSSTENSWSNKWNCTQWINEFNDNTLFTITAWNECNNGGAYSAGTATISSVSLSGNWGENDAWDAPKAFTADGTTENKWTLSFDSFNDAKEFKLVVNDGTNNIWLGSNQLTLEDASGLVTVGSDQTNFTLKAQSTFGYKNYDVTASWVPSNNAANNWTLTFAGKEFRDNVPGIVGDWTTDGAGWDNDIEMTRDATNPYIFKLTVKDFDVIFGENETSRTWYYKMRTNKNWDTYNVPETGNNNFVFYEEGTYKLEFTADLSSSTPTLSLVAQKIIVLPGETIWSSETPVEISWGNPIFIEASKFANAKVGDEFHVQVDNITDGAQVLPKSAWNDLEGGIILSSNAQEASFTLTGDILRLIKKSGLQICGTGCTTTLVTLETTTLTGSDESIWVGNVTGSGEFGVNFSHFRNANDLNGVKAGDIIRVIGTGTGSVQFFDYDKATELTCEKTDVGYDFVVTEGIIEKLKESYVSAKVKFTDMASITEVQLLSAALNEISLTLIGEHHISSTELDLYSDDTVVKLYVSNISDPYVSRNGWGIGRISNYGNWSENDYSVQLGGQDGTSWVIQTTIGDLKRAGKMGGEEYVADDYGNTGVTINYYNDCKVDEVSIIVPAVQDGKYYLIEDVNSKWTIVDEMSESEGVYTTAMGNMADKYFAIAPSTAFNTAGDGILHWEKVIRPETNSGDFEVNYFVNYSNNTNGTNGVWHAEAINEANLTLTYTPASNNFTITTDATESVTISSAGYATYSNAAAYKVSGTDVKVNTVTSADPSIMLTPLDAGFVIPGRTGVVLEGSGSVTITPRALTDDIGEVSGNMLVGSNNYTYNLPGSYTADNIYLLANGKHGVGFYKWNGNTSNEEDYVLAAHKAFLVTTSGAREFLGFDEEGGTTGVEELKNSNTEELKSYFNLAGQRVAQPTKGLYIVNGRKVVIK